MNPLQPRSGATPEPPRLRPTWTTWMWLAFAVSVLIATVVGLWLAGKPFWD